MINYIHLHIFNWETSFDEERLSVEEEEEDGNLKLITAVPDTLFSKIRRTRRALRKNQNEIEL